MVAVHAPWKTGRLLCVRKRMPKCWCGTLNCSLLALFCFYRARSFSFRPSSTKQWGTFINLIIHEKRVKERMPSNEMLAVRILFDCMLSRIEEKNRWRGRTMRALLCYVCFFGMRQAIHSLLKNEWIYSAGHRFYIWCSSSLWGEISFYQNYMHAVCTLTSGSLNFRFHCVRRIK